MCSTGALGILGILEGKNATCYPGFEDQLKGAKFKAVPVVTDGKYYNKPRHGYIYIART